jgi:hypothetical protein
MSRAPIVLADLAVLTVIRSFRERPLVMFSRGTWMCVLAALLSSIPAFLEQTQPGHGRSLVLPALPLVWLELACFLLLLGLIAEVVLRRHRSTHRGQRVLVRGLS